MTAAAFLDPVHSSAVVMRRKIADIRLATKLSTISRNPGINTRSKDPGAWEVEDWNQHPHQRTVPDQPAKSKEPFIDRLALDHRVHRIVNICFAQFRETRKRLGHVCIIEAKRVIEIQRSDNSQRANTKSALAIINHVNRLGRHL